MTGTYDDEWKQITDGRRLWFAGVFCVRCLTTGKAYFIGTCDVGKRVWDNLDRLRRGNHPCRELQRDWAERPENFAFFLVTRVSRVQWLVRLTKQAWIDVARGQAGGAYNAKNSVPKRRRRSPRAAS